MAARQCKMVDDCEISINCFLIDSIINQSPNPMWISDSAGTLIRINKACTDLLKISEKEVVGIYNILSDNIVREQGLMPLVQGVFEKGETARFEIRYDSADLESLHLQDHAYVILDVTVFPIKDEHQNVTNAVIQHIDITKRRQSEEALQLNNVELDARVRERTSELTRANAALRKEIAERALAEEELGQSEQRYRLLFNQMLDGFALHEVVASATGGPLDFRVLDINPALEQMTGTQKSHVVGRQVRDLFPKSEVAWVEQLAGVAQTGQARTFPFDSPSLGRHFDVSAFVPKPGQVAAIFVDVTKRFLMEQALRESEELFRTLCAAAPIGIYMANAQGSCIYSNPRLQELMGLSDEQSLGWGWSSALHPEDREQTSSIWLAAVTAGGVFQHECRLISPQGNPVWIRGLARPFNGPDGAIAGYVGIVEDITEQRHAREELLKTQKLESLGVLAGGIAHDFNNILTIILGYLSLARSNAQDPEVVESRLKEGEKGVMRARDLTQQLLTFARGGDPVKKIVRLNQLLRESADFGSLGSNVRCEFLLSDADLLLSADEGQLSQVVHNLVINAIQAMPEGGTITISSEAGVSPAGEAMARFSVSDTGTGIPEPIISKVFDPYFTTKQGSGLGLTSCYSIVKRHGGTMTVDSVPGEGSSFSVSLPAYLRHSEPEPVERVAERRGSGRILLMDDDPLIQKVARAMLEQLGYGADCVADGKAALELYRRKQEEGEPYAAVIMDLTVRGGMGGKDAIGVLLEMDPQVKAVVSSSYSDDPVLANCREHGFCSVLVKPYSRQEMSRVLHELLTR